MWKIKDYTKSKAGYLQLTRDGTRVCEFFPFAKDADPRWVRAQAEYICDLLNGGIAAETSR